MQNDLKSIPGTRHQARQLPRLQQNWEPGAVPSFYRSSSANPSSSGFFGLSFCPVSFAWTPVPFLEHGLCTYLPAPLAIPACWISLNKGTPCRCCPNASPSSCPRKPPCSHTTTFFWSVFSLSSLPLSQGTPLKPIASRLGRLWMYLEQALA